MGTRFKVSLLYLAPILWSQLFGVACSFLILASSVPLYTVTPFPESLTGSLGNTSYFVVLTAFGGLLMYFLVKRRSRRIIALITGSAVVTAMFLLSFIYLSAALSALSVGDAEILGLASALPVAIFASFLVFKVHSILQVAVVLSLGGALGAFLGASIPTLSAVLILSALAVYDTLAVFWGPLGKIAVDGLDQLPGLSFSFRQMQMGLGDVVFYSMLSSHVFVNRGFVACIASVIGILLGCLAGFKALEKKPVLPGLPLPIFLGLLAGLSAPSFL